MATIAMRQVREGEVPRDGGTAVQEDPDRPVFHGNGPDDYVCVSAATCSPSRCTPADDEEGARPCGRCTTVNVAVIDGYLETQK